MNDVLQILLGWVGIVIWLVGIFFAIALLVDREENIGSRMSFGVMCFLIFGSLGMAFACAGIFSPVRNCTYTYEVPTSIVKTNDVVIVNHVVGGQVKASLMRNSAEYWNTTNIMTEVKSGKNFFGKDVRPNYNIVLH